MPVIEWNERLQCEDVTNDYDEQILSYQDMVC